MSKYLYCKSDTYNFAHKSCISLQTLRPEGAFTNRVWTRSCIERRSHAFHEGTTTWSQVPLAWLQVLEQSLPTSTQDPGRPSLENLRHWFLVGIICPMQTSLVKCVCTHLFLDETPTVPGKSVGLGKKTDLSIFTKLGNGRLGLSKATLWPSWEPVAP